MLEKDQQINPRKTKIEEKKGIDKKKIKKEKTNIKI